MLYVVMTDEAGNIEMKAGPYKEGDTAAIYDKIAQWEELINGPAKAKRIRASKIKVLREAYCKEYGL